MSTSLSFATLASAMDLTKLREKILTPPFLLGFTCPSPVPLPLALGPLKQFLNWSFEEGQMVAVSMGYAPLPGRIAAKARAAVHALR